MSVCLMILLSFSCRWGEDWPPADWTQQQAPFAIEGSVYYVGGAELTAYLLVDEAGLILINVGMAENVSLVFDNIRQLGFDPAKIHYLLITQAHFDHAGGAQSIQAETQAEVVAGFGDTSLLLSGGKNDHVFGDRLLFAPVNRVRGVKNGDHIQCGQLTVEAVATPGHTPGSTSWRYEDAKTGKTFFFQASLSLLDDAEIHNNALYPQVAQDFASTLEKLTRENADFYLPDHLQFAKPPDALADAVPNPEWFRDRSLLTRQIERCQKALDKKMTVIPGKD
ncbi:MAG: MBL fold metallo-hydrolase [Acidobacteria bacterium]|nr:MBL fold metallo-hydrolase [Acidobacteriota bacterium]MCB9398643.1 MBL fold metallo-hydrolase [Acidobacteriota bacterium]